MYFLEPRIHWKMVQYVHARIATNPMMRLTSALGCAATLITNLSRDNANPKLNATAPPLLLSGRPFRVASQSRMPRSRDPESMDARTHATGCAGRMD